MKDFVHLHVHTQYSILDGQASIPNLVEKALKDGMRGMAVTDHGNMMGIKEFYNYVKSKRKSAQSALKDLQEKLLALDTAEDFGEYATREEAQRLWSSRLLPKSEQQNLNLFLAVKCMWLVAECVLRNARRTSLDGT